MATGCAMIAALALVAGCPAKNENKKPVKPPRTDYNQIWGNITAEGEKGQMDLKDARRALGEAQTDDETDKANGQIVEALKTIFKAVEEADKFFETMKKLQPDVNIDAWEKQVSEWNQDYQHSKKQLPLKYAEMLNN